MSSHISAWEKWSRVSGIWIAGISVLWFKELGNNCRQTAGERCVCSQGPKHCWKRAQEGDISSSFQLTARHNEAERGKSWKLCTSNNTYKYWKDSNFSASEWRSFTYCNWTVSPGILYFLRFTSIRVVCLSYFLQPYKSNIKICTQDIPLTSATIKIKRPSKGQK